MIHAVAAIDAALARQSSLTRPRRSPCERCSSTSTTTTSSCSALTKPLATCGLSRRAGSDARISPARSGGGSSMSAAAGEARGWSRVSMSG